MTYQCNADKVYMETFASERFENEIRNKLKAISIVSRKTAFQCTTTNLQPLKPIHKENPAQHQSVNQSVSYLGHHNFKVLI